MSDKDLRCGDERDGRIFNPLYLLARIKPSAHFALLCPLKEKREDELYEELGYTLCYKQKDPKANKGLHLTLMVELDSYVIGLLRSFLWDTLEQRRNEPPPGRP